MQRLLFVFVTVLLSTSLEGRTLLVGPGRPYADPARAARDAQPGDTILVGPGTYRGTFWIEGLQGTEAAPVVIRGEDRTTVVFDGGTEALHLSECVWVTLENFTVRGQTANGINIDDGGTLETPTHHITVRSVTFTTMAATGNNDFLKLSGLEDFLVEDCSFTEGAEGGSGIDMVGCHRGRIVRNRFQSLGSNAIQAKGGTQNIEIRANRFIDAGQRALNLGGSTGLQFFRPMDAPFEAADLRVVANLFIGGATPIAYVGSVNVDVANNTIVRPTMWVLRVLQETVEPRSRFEPCGRNIFRNNLIIYGSGLRAHVNIGGNTAPETFTVQNNLWYNADAPASSRPYLGVMTERNGLYGTDPRCVDPTGGDGRLRPGSPAIAAGTWFDDLGADILGTAFVNPPSIGAYEGGSTTSVQATDQPDLLSYGDGVVTVRTTHPLTIHWYDVRGRRVMTTPVQSGEHTISLNGERILYPVIERE